MRFLLVFLLSSTIFSISFIFMMFLLCYTFFSIRIMLFFTLVMHVSIDRNLINCLYDQLPLSENILGHLIGFSLSQEYIISYEECWESLFRINRIFNTVDIEQLQNKGLFISI